MQVLPLFALTTLSLFWYQLDPPMLLRLLGYGDDEREPVPGSPQMPNLPWRLIFCFCFVIGLK